MNCLACKNRSCRSTVSCGIESFDTEKSLATYHADEQQQIVQKAADLVDGGRAGELSRIEEVIEFAKMMDYKKVGLAYCYGMEPLAKKVQQLFRAAKVPVIGVSCTVGGVSQKAINKKSDLPGVSCNPVNQASQLNAEGVDLAVTIGLCMGHDILFNRIFDKDVTNLVVKDRVYAHAPVEAINAQYEKLNS